MQKKNKGGGGTQREREKSPFSEGVDPCEWCQTQLSRGILSGPGASFLQDLHDDLPFTVFAEQTASPRYPFVARIKDKKQGEFPQDRKI